MNIELLSNAKVEELSAEIDRQLQELSPAPNFTAVLRAEEESEIPEQYYKQLETVESTTGEPAKSFIQRFLYTARLDLCTEGGMLHEQ